jgi:hypothetical protein
MNLKLTHCLLFCDIERFLLQPKRTLKEENITPETKLKLKVLWWKTPFKWVDPVALHFFYHEVHTLLNLLSFVQYTACNFKNFILKGERIYHQW